MRHSALAVLVLASALGLGSVDARAQGTAQTASSGSAIPSPLFANITLTAAQQQQIGAIRTRYLAQAHVMQDSVRMVNAALVDAEQKSDQAAIVSATTRLRSWQTRLQSLLLTERADMRAMLTGAQVAQYDANVAADTKMP